jgi:hypothetical protein
MNIEILSTAEDDLVDGHSFYERQESGIGNYFLDTLIAEIDSLQLYAGTHRKKWGKYRMLSKRFPFGIFYTMEKDTVSVCAVLDLRRRPSFLRRKVRREI